jgi:hypothetical protein
VVIRIRVKVIFDFLLYLMLLFLQYTRGYRLLILTTVIELSLFPILTIKYMG